MRFTMMEYNTERNHLGLREYGRHIQRMVEYVMTIEDRDKRNLQAKAVIELMGFLNPHLRNVDDFRHMLWDHLFAISDFKLEVDSPYPIPQKETYKLKGEPMKYPRRYPKYAHLGKNLEMVIDKALKEDDAEKKVGFANSIAYYMKLTYSNWHKELVHDDTIRTELNIITDGALEFSATPFIKHRANTGFEREEFGNTRNNNNNNRRQNFTGRNSNSRPQSGNSNRPAGNSNRNASPQRESGNRPNGTAPTSNRNNNRNFKKRY
ncbi:MAG: DUF4290 domain-containing protein [Flavobacterium sp.]|nr:DUF4290 domain-containing protein [Flavobacterium sp.]